jgi:hypothetical protein
MKDLIYFLKRTARDIFNDYKNDLQVMTKTDFEKFMKDTFRDKFDTEERTQIFTFIKDNDASISLSAFEKYFQYETLIKFY